MLSTRTSQPFRRAKPKSRILQLIPKGDRQLAVGSVRSVYEGQRLAIPIGRSLESHVKRLTIHRDAEVHRNRRLVMLDAHKPALNNRRDNWTERRRSNVDRSLPVHSDTSPLNTRSGSIRVPSGPGIGVTIDPDYLKQAKIVTV